MSKLSFLFVFFLFIAFNFNAAAGPDDEKENLLDVIVEDSIGHPLPLPLNPLKEECKKRRSVAQNPPKKRRQPFPESPTKAQIRQLNAVLTEEQAYLAGWLLHAARSKKRRISPTIKKDDATFSPNTKIASQHVTSPHLREMKKMCLTALFANAVIPMRREVKQPVLHPDFQDEILGPPLRYAGVSRSDVEALKNKLGMDILEPTDYSHLSQEDLDAIEQAETERVEAIATLREAREKAATDYADLKGINPLAVEEGIWQPFFDYFDDRKNNILFSDERKITAAEIVRVFHEKVSSNYRYLKVEKYHVFYQPELMALDIEIDPVTGETNMDLIQNQFNPIGWDGRPMHVHHLTHYDAATHGGECVVVLVSHQLHSKDYNGGLHFRNSSVYNKLRRLDRGLFDRQRKNIMLLLSQKLSSQKLSS